MDNTINQIKSNIIQFEALNVVSDIVEAAERFAGVLDSHCPDCEEKNTAMARLYECVEWAKDSVALHYGDE